MVISSSGGLLELVGEGDGILGQGTRPVPVTVGNGLPVVDLELHVPAACGEPLSFRQEDVKLTGHAIECRINAEDPEAGFRPSPGVITQHVSPGGMGVRVDTHCYSGYRIPANYGANYERLVQIKRQYDPENVFHVNQNIKP